jgi:ketol-acid reductoisomerase
VTIATAARELLTALDDAPRTPQATVQRQYTNMSAVFSRDPFIYMLTIRSDEPITKETAQEWAKAMGAKRPDFLPTPDKRGWHIEWEVQG